MVKMVNVMSCILYHNDFFKKRIRGKNSAEQGDEISCGEVLKGFSDQVLFKRRSTFQGRVKG